MTLMSLLMIALGGAAGAVCRFLTGMTVSYYLGNTFPYGTLAANVLGSFVIGFTYFMLAQKQMLGSHGHLFSVIGFLGAYTTFSSFSLETLELFQHEAYMAASLYVISSVILCLLAVFLGAHLAKLFI